MPIQVDSWPNPKHGLTFGSPKIAKDATVGFRPSLHSQSKSGTSTESHLAWEVHIIDPGILFVSILKRDLCKREHWEHRNFAFDLKLKKGAFKKIGGL